MKAFDGASMVQFLKHLLSQIDGKLLLIWDELSAHRIRTIKDFLTAGEAQRLHLERLPTHAPDLNSGEGVWNYLKHVELANVSCHKFDDLRHQLRQASEITPQASHYSVLLSCC